MPTLFLHAGLAKTGTSAIQRWFDQNAAALGATGICYPRYYPDAPFFFPSDSVEKQQFLVGELRSHGPRTLLKVAEENRGRSILLSTEGMTNHLQDFAPEHLQAFRTLFAEYKVKALLVTRDLDSWSRSYYKQALISPNNGASELWGSVLGFDDFVRQPRFQRLCDTEALTAGLSTAFNADVTVIKYSRSMKDELCAWLGVDPNTLSDIPQVHESIPDWGAEIMRRLNGIEHEMHDRAAFISALRAGEEQNSGGSGSPELRPDLLKAVKDSPSAFPLAQEAEAFLTRRLGQTNGAAP